MSEEEFDKMLLDLFNKGLINVEYDDNLEVVISLTEDGEAVVRNAEDK